jgi:hypothetical protein
LTYDAAPPPPAILPLAPVLTLDIRADNGCYGRLQPPERPAAAACTLPALRQAGTPGEVVPEVERVGILKMQNIHWNYYLALESDLAEISRYIEFDRKNFKTYSIELARLLQTAAAEIDVVGKEICRYLEPTATPKNIHDYRKIIVPKLPAYVNEIIYIPRFGLQFRPWATWRFGKTPSWWTGYTDVKHHRAEHFSKANLKFVLYSMGGLLVSVYYFYKLKFQAEGKPVSPRDDVALELKADPGFLQLQDGYYPDYIIAG